VKKHTKVGQHRPRHQDGGIITTGGPGAREQLMLVDPDTKKQTRVGIRVDTVRSATAGSSGSGWGAKAIGKDI